VTDLEDPDEGHRTLRAPSGGNGFDAPSSGDGPGTQGRSGGPAGRRGAERNGHHSPPTAVPGTPEGLRGRWIVPLAVVSAITGMCMFLGVLIGGGIAAAAGLRDTQVLAPAFLGLMLAGLAGVWLGARIAIRLTGGDPQGRLVLTGIFATMGLAIGLGLLILAARIAVILVAGLGLIAPGIGAAIGDRIALARKLRDSGQGR
jgi:hypothetical protein